MASEAKDVANEIVGFKITNIWSTIVCLTLRPGQTIKRYYDGDKSGLIPPVGYYSMAMFLTYLLLSYSGYYNAAREQREKMNSQVTESIGKATTDADKRDLEQAQKLLTVYKFVSEDLASNETARYLVSLPLILLFRWLFFRKYGKGLKANAWYCLYGMGHTGMLSALPLVTIWLVSRDILTAGYLASLFFPMFFAYDVWASMQFYGILLETSILRCLLYYLAFFASAGFLAVTFLILYVFL